MWGSRDPVLEFWDPLISRKRFKLETTNLARMRMVLSSNEENAKLGQMGSCGGHVTQFWNFEPPPPNISRTVEDRSFKFGTETDGSEF